MKCITSFSKKSLILGACALILLIVLIFSLKSDNGVENITEGDSENEIIIEAFEEFEAMANLRTGADRLSLCKGGFLNEENPELAALAQKIVANRTIDRRLGTLAANQDEAGISCLSSENKWVLFSALNSQSDEDLEYYCADSSGKKGKYGLDRALMKCQEQE